ncbi:uncharacterized protein [Drosophila pseudoobscura]|uniref:Trichohyalin n=1 Tax=Drosophila pseudoobscura pseudoobscura TaxID=46245 RepID=A0A6I8V4Y7_DROPS|nr:uncharacterized protein LOC6898064 [Drosophila pseudoobscura]
MQVSLLHRCTKMVLLKKQVRRKGWHLRSYRHQAYRRLRMMSQIRDELLRKVRKAIEARQRDMEQVKRDQARHEVARTVATYTRWLHSWSKSLLSQRRLIVQQRQEERKLDRRLRLLRKQLGRHRRPQRLLERCLLKLRKGLERTSILHPTIEGQADIWEQEVEEVRRYLSAPYDSRKKSRKPRHGILGGFTDFWNMEVLRKKRPRTDYVTAVTQNPSGQLYVVPALPARPSKPWKPKKKKHADLDPDTDYVNLIELPGEYKSKRLKKKLKMLKRSDTSDTRLPKPTIDELWQMYADLVEVEAGRQSKAKKAQRKRRRKRSRTPRQMNLKKLLDLDRPADVNVVLKRKVARKKSGSGKHEPMESGLLEETNVNPRPEKKQSLLKRKRKMSGLRQKTETLSDIGPNLKKVRKHQKKGRSVSDGLDSHTSDINEKDKSFAKKKKTEKGKDQIKPPIETENEQDRIASKRDGKDAIRGENTSQISPLETEITLENTEGEISLQNNVNLFKKDKQAKYSMDTDPKALVKLSKKQRGVRKSGKPGSKQKVTKVEELTPGKRRLLSTEESDRADGQKIDPPYFDEDSDLGSDAKNSENNVNMVRMDMQAKYSMDTKPKTLVKLSKKQKGSRKSGSKPKETKAEDVMLGKWRFQRPIESAPADGHKVDPPYFEEDHDVKTRPSFHLRDLRSDPKYSVVQRLLKNVIESNSVLEGTGDIRALMTVVGKHNMWDKLAGLYSELQTTGIAKSDIVSLLSKKYLDYLRGVEKEYLKNPTLRGESLTESKFKIKTIDVPSEIIDNIGWLNESMRGEHEHSSNFTSHDPSNDMLQDMGNASEIMDSDVIKKLIDQEKQMERELRDERRRKLNSASSGRFPSTSSMSEILEIDPKEEKNLLNFEMRYSLKSIRNMMEQYTQYFKSLAKSPVIMALEKERRLIEANLETLRDQSLATSPNTTMARRRPYIPKEKKLRPAQKLFYSPRQTCRVKNLNDDPDDWECCSVCSHDSLVEERPRVYEKCPRCGVKVELPAPTPQESLRSLSQGSIEACAKNKLLLSTVVDICTHCGYIHEKGQSCPQLPICPVPLQHLRRVEEAVQAQIPMQPPGKKPGVLLCCSPCGILRKPTRYADR